MSTTITKKEIVLTEEQQNGVNQLIEWTTSKEQEHDYFAVLKGSAGCGKTTVLNTFLKNYKRRVVVSAPTHKAKTVVANITGRPSATLQSLLGLRPDTTLAEYDIDNPIFTVLGENKMSEYDLVVIDEASMINDQLYKLIYSMAIDNRVKVLFVGDELQLPPVKEEKALALNSADIIVELKSVIRQSNSNPLNEVLFMLREDILNKTSKVFDFLLTKRGQKFFNDDEEGYEVLEYAQAADDITDKFKTFSIDNPNSLRYISWTNKNVSQMNQYIRSKIYDNPFVIMENELIMSYRTISQRIQSGRNVTYDEIIINSEDYVVENSTPSQSQGIVGIECMLRPVNSGGLRRKIFIVQPSSIPMFLKEHDKLHQEAINSPSAYQRKNNWQSYYAFKNYFLILGSVKQTAGKKEKNIPKDMDYAYGITVHKSQGSTYEQVIVNVADIAKCFDITERNKLLYVATSRASKSVCFLI